MNASRHLTKLLNRTELAARVDPARDWLLVLIVAFGILLTIVGWSVWNFNILLRDGIAPDASAVSTEPAFNKTSVEAVRIIFADRAAEEAKYVSGVYSFADPSQ